MRYNIELQHKNLRKVFSVSPNLSSDELGTMIGYGLGLREKMVGVSDKHGKFYSLEQMLSKLSILQRSVHYLVTFQPVGRNLLSFGDDPKQSPRQIHKNKRNKQNNKNNKFRKNQQSTCLPQPSKEGCLGMIGDLELFEDLLLEEQQKLIIVNCFTKDKYPQQVPFGHYIYQTDKNSTIVYFGRRKMCQFYTDEWSTHSPKEIYDFIQSINPIKRETTPESDHNQEIYNTPVQPNDEVEHISEDQDVKNAQLKESLIQNLQKLREDEDIDEIQYYKLKLMALQKPQEFIRRYQMGTRKGLRSQRTQNIKNQKKRSRVTTHQPTRNLQGPIIQQSTHHYQQPPSGMGSRQHHRNTIPKKYEIPIIVRKYNNVIEKISTSYPLSIEQQQAINLVMELQLKGLISEKQSGEYKSLILQQQSQTFPLFVEYFNDLIDQIELTNRLRVINRQKKSVLYRKNSIDPEDKKQQNMRLLIRSSRQKDFQLLRKLFNESNEYIISCLEKYRENKSNDELTQKLQKIADFYRTKEELQSFLKYQ